MCTTRAHKATSSKQCLPNTNKHTCSFARYLILILMATNLDTTLKFYKIFCARSRRGRERVRVAKKVHHMTTTTYTFWWRCSTYFSSFPTPPFRCCPSISSLLSSILVGYWNTRSIRQCNLDEMPIQRRKRTVYPQKKKKEKKEPPPPTTTTTLQRQQR